MIKFEDLLYAYELTKKNKQKSIDTSTFETNREVNLIRLYNDINNRTIDTSKNYSFVVFSPKPREIFATYMSNRIIHHYIDWKLRPIYEQILSPFSFNNRIGFGQHKAIETFREFVRQETNNYTEDAWLFHLDFKGYFPNADVEIAYNQQKELIDNYYFDYDKEDILYMLDKVMHADPARNCVQLGIEDWKYINPEKSLFNKPIGTGGAIGFLCWQNAMGMYVNEEIKWLSSLGFKLVIFVDDLYVVTKYKKEFLNIIPEFRNKLKQKKIYLNERKFYCQHFSKGIQILGTRLKFNRKYIDNKTCNRALNKLGQLNLKYFTKEQILSSINCYFGMLKRSNNYNRLLLFKCIVLNKFKNIMDFNDSKQCFKLNINHKTKIMKKYNFS